MSTADRYAIPLETYEWKVPEEFESRFKWEYEDGAPLFIGSMDRRKAAAASK